MRQHRRLYVTDLPMLTPTVVESLFRNRILMVLPESALTSTNLEEWAIHYEEWLDENVTALYMLDIREDDEKLLVAFESEGDMMQFALALR